MAACTKKRYKYSNYNADYMLLHLVHAPLNFYDAGFILYEISFRNVSNSVISFFLNNDNRE